MKRRPVFVSTLILAALSGCVSVEPDWITSFPASPGYYIGIGSSNTGDRGRDMELARSKALAGIASEISTQIRSEQRLTTRETSEGGSYVEAEVVISETVGENLRDVETVDSYYSKELGYWILLRLNKAAWERIQREETAGLVARVTDLLEEEYGRPGSTEAGRISALGKAWTIVVDSPYAELLSGELFGTEGSLLDLIETELQRRVEGLSILFEPAEIVGEIGRPIPLTMTVVGSDSTPAGKFSVDLSAAGIGVFQRLTTDAGGVYDGALDASPLALGKSVLTARLDLERHGIEIDRIPRAVNPPTRELPVDLRQISAGLTLGVPEEMTIPNIRGAVVALLSDLVPFKIAEPTADDRFTVDVELSLRKAPASRYTEGLVFVFIEAVFSVRSDGRTLFSYRSEEHKGGGLSLSQAQDKAFDALLRGLREDEELSSRFAGILSYE